MSFWKQFGIGLRSYKAAFNYIFTKGLWWFLIFPLFINIFLFLGGNTLIGNFIELSKTTVLDWTSLNEMEFWGSAFLVKAMNFTISLLLRFMFFVLFAYLGGYVVIIIMSPVFAYLSELTEKKHLGNDYPFNIVQFMRDIGRGIVLALRNLFIEIGLIIAILIFTLIPVLGWLIGLLSPVILFFISAYFYGFSFIDYAVERRKLSVRQSIKLMRKYKGLAMANGSVFALSMVVPFCGVSISSFVAIFSIVAGTIAIDEVLKQEKN